MILLISFFILKLLFWEVKYFMSFFVNVFLSKIRMGWDKGFYVEISI